MKLCKIIICRRVLLERYKLYSSLGYPVPFPRLQFSRMMALVFRRCLCCLGWCIPEEDSEYPQIPNVDAAKRGFDLSFI